KRKDDVRPGIGEYQLLELIRQSDGGIHEPVALDEPTQCRAGQADFVHGVHLADYFVRRWPNITPIIRHIGNFPCMAQSVNGEVSSGASTGRRPRRSVAYLIRARSGLAGDRKSTRLNSSHV